MTFALDLQMQKQLTLAFVFFSVLVAVFVTVQSKRGTVRRLAAAYVTGIDERRRAMYLPANGATTATAQAGGIVLALALYGASGSALFIVAALAVALVPSILLRVQVQKRRSQIDEQANGFALTLSNALKATASIGDALKSTTDVTARPLKEELTTVQRHIRVGSTLEEALLLLSARVQSSALDVVVSTLLVGRQCGGDLPRILEGTAASLRELKRLEHFTDKTTRSAKQSLALSAAITAGLAILLPYMFEGFLEPLRTTYKGQLYAAQMTFVFVAALYLGYRITRKAV